MFKFSYKFFLKSKLQVLEQDLAVFGFFAALGRRTQSFLSANGSVVADERVAGLLRYLIGGSTLFYPQLASLNTYKFFVEVVCEEMDWLPFYHVSSFKARLDDCTEAYATTTAPRISNKWSTNAEHNGFPHKGLGADVRRGAQELDGSKKDLEGDDRPSRRTSEQLNFEGSQKIDQLKLFDKIPYSVNCQVSSYRRTQSFLSANGSVDADERVAGLLRYMIGGSTLFYPQLASLNTYQFFIEVVYEEMDWLPFYHVSSFKARLDDCTEAYAATTAPRISNKWSTNAEHNGFPHKGLGADVRRGAQELDGSKKDLEGPIDEKHVMEDRSMKPSVEEINTTHTRFHLHIKEYDMTPLSRSIGLYRTASEAVSKLSLGSATSRNLSMEFDAMLVAMVASGIQQASTLEDQRQEQLPEIQ
ncbi:hypothetical protein L7F22_015058 [Adiantum nelumboides]|nr:hypothetical protein [Adiantum nelumboides]